jgi:hypothetical protein
LAVLVRGRLLQSPVVRIAEGLGVLLNFVGQLVPFLRQSAQPFGLLPIADGIVGEPFGPLPGQLLFGLLGPARRPGQGRTAGREGERLVGREGFRRAAVRKGERLIARGDVSGATEREFLESWRAELLERTWLALAEIERKTGQPCYSVLRCRADQPTLSSADLAEQLGRQLGKPFTVPSVRQALYRAREKFTDLLLDEVARSLEDPSAEQVEEELINLGLLGYCQTALQRRGRC